MATYLQGVTDYIPQFQPFQPDLNFYGNVMQTKQTQYDSNWKALNKMYGQYYYADLTRDDNTEKRDKYLKNIDFQLKRVSQLDLSLQQNAEQATQIFKPFYEDKGLMKDMAWTKNKNNQLNRAEIFKVSTDAKDKEQYWEDGVRGVNYMTDEFKEATAEEALNFQNAEYVPYVNVIKKANEIADKAKLNIVTPSFSQDGKWMIKTRNGEAILEPLQDLFEAELGNDPAVQAVYKMQAYVDRKDYAYGNASQFGGDKMAAEMRYLENGFNVLKQQSDLRYRSLQDSATVYDSKIQDLEEQVANGTASPLVKQQLDQYKLNREIAQKNLARAKEENDIMNMDEDTYGTTSNGFINPYGDIRSLRYKVDNGMAAMLLRKDLSQAAQIFMNKNMEQEMAANPYAILEQKKRDSLALIAAKEQANNRNKIYELSVKQKLEDGTHTLNAFGELVPVEEQNFVRTEEEKAGATTANINMKNKSRSISQMTKEEYLDPYMQTTFVILDKALKAKKINKQEISNILGYDKNKNISLEEFTKKYNTYGDTWLRKYVGKKGVEAIKTRMDAWVNNNSQLNIFTRNGQKTQAYNDYRAANMKMDEYQLYLKEDMQWRTTTSKRVEESLKKEGFGGAFLLYDERGELRSEAEYYDALSKHNIGNYNAIVNKNNLIDKQFNRFLKKRENELTEGNLPTVTGNAVGQRAAMDANRKTEIPDKYNYKKMVQAAGKAYMNKAVYGKIPATRLGTGPDGGSGTSSLSSVITVNPKGVSMGKAHFADVMADLNGFDWFGNSDKVTFAGIGKYNYDNALANSKDIGKRLLEDLKKDMSNPKSKLGKFDLKVSPIAAGSSNKSAVIIKPNKEWLDQYLSTAGEGKTPNNLLNADIYNMILKNGISFITDSKKMKSSMYRNAYKTPLEAYVDNHEEGYRLENIGGDPYKSYTITKNTLGTGDYTTEVTWGMYDPIEKKIVEQSFTNNVGFQGKNLRVNMENILVNFYDQVDYQSTLNLNGNY